jgi:hypothetical protein
MTGIEGEGPAVPRKNQKGLRMLEPVNFGISAVQCGLAE